MCQNTVSGFEGTGAHDAFQGWVRGTGSGYQACMPDEASLADSGWHYHRRYSEQPWASRLMIIFSVVGLVWALGKVLAAKGPDAPTRGRPNPKTDTDRGGEGLLSWPRRRLALALLAWCLQLEAAGVLLGISQHALALKSLFGVSGRGFERCACFGGCLLTAPSLPSTLPMFAGAVTQSAELRQLVQRSRCGRGSAK